MYLSVIILFGKVNNVRNDVGHEPQADQHNLQYVFDSPVPVHKLPTLA